MKRSRILWIAILVVSFSLIGCQAAREQGKAEELVDTWFEPYMKSGALADEFWGMDIQDVFGPVCPHPDWFGSLYHSRTFRYKDTEGYLIRLQCWLKGVDADGAPLKISRDVYVSVKPVPPNDEMKIENYYFENEKPLSGWKQIGLWLLWSTIGPLIPISFALYAFTDFWALLTAYPIVIVIGFLAWIIYVGQVSYWIFGSYWAMIAGCLVFIILVWFLSGFVKVLQQLKGSTT